MLSAIRKFAKSWVALLLIVPLLIAFAVFGIGDVFQPQVGNWVVKVGERSVTTQEFTNLFEQNIKQPAAQQFGRPVTNQELVQQGFHTRLLDELANSESLLEQLRRVRLVPSDKLVATEIRKAPVFFNPVTGQFDQQAYTRQLAQNGYTEEQFERYLRDQIAQQHYAAAVLAGVKAPRVYAAAGAAFESEMRDISAMVVSPAMVEEPPAPTDAQLTQFMQQNAERLRRPEFRALTLVRFDPAALAATLPVDPADVQRAYDFRKNSADLSTPERRTLVQISSQNAQTAAQIAQRLRGGEAPAAVARALNAQLIPHANVPQSALPDRRVAEAAFRLPVGQVSDPIQGELGYSVVVVTGIVAGRTTTLEEARPAIEQALRQEQAQERVLELVHKFEEAKENGSDLIAAARAVGVPAVSIAPVTERGQDQSAAQQQIEPQILEAAFDLDQGAESEIIDLGQGRYAVARVDRIVPAALPALADVRDQLAQAWRAEELERRLTARAEQLVAQIRGGQSLQAVAQAAGAPPVNSLAGLTRASQNVPPQVLGRIFEGKAGEVFSAPGGRGVLIGRVDAVRFPPAQVAAATLEQRRNQLSVQMTELIGEAARLGPRRTMKVRINAERAAQALGVSPEAATGEPAQTER